MDPNPESVEAKASAIDWEQVERWDRRYYLHNFQTPDDAWTAVSHQEGNYLYLSDGTRLLDFQSQLISDNLGHRHPRVVAELRRALDRYGHVYFGMATDYRARAAKLLIEDVLGPDDWAGRLRLLASGTDAVDVAVGMARLVTGRELVLAQEHSFHGFTAGTGTRMRGYRNQLSSGTADEWVRDVPGYPPHGFLTIPAPEHQEDDVSGGLASLRETERLIDEIGGEKIAAVVTETMFGAGGLMGHDAYLTGLRELTRRHGILWIDDEVLCGFGRLGRWFGYQLYEGLRPDLMAIGKGLNGCLLPVGGIVAGREVAEVFERDRWLSGSTWDGHPLVAATVVATIETMLDEGLVERAAELGVRLRAGLEELRGRHPTVGRIGGHGLFHAVDLVDGDGRPIVRADRSFTFTGDLEQTPNHIIARVAAAHGVSLGGFVPNTVKVAPPLTVTPEEIELALQAFDAGLDELDRLHA